MPLTHNVSLVRVRGAHGTWESGGREKANVGGHPNSDPPSKPVFLLFHVTTILMT